MQKIQKRIEILRSNVKQLSSLSIESADGMLAELKLHFEEVVITVIQSRSDLEMLVLRRPSLVIMGLKYIPDVDASTKLWVSTYLEENDIAYTGSNAHAHELETNKALAKQRVHDMGLKTSPYLVIKTGVPYLDTSLLLQFPLFVKPTSMGGGAGVDNDSVVHNFADLRTKTGSISFEHASDSLVEQYLPGREFSVAVLKEEFSDNLLAMPIEIVTVMNSRGDRVLSKDVKALNEEQALPVVDPLVKAQLSEIAIGVFEALGASDYGRIDIRMDEFGVPHFLEANLIPSLINGYGNFPKACALNLGMDYGTMLLHIVNLGMAKSSGLIKPTPEPLAI